MVSCDRDYCMNSEGERKMSIVIAELPYDKNYVICIIYLILQDNIEALKTVCFEFAKEIYLLISNTTATLLECSFFSPSQRILRNMRNINQYLHLLER